MQILLYLLVFLFGFYTYKTFFVYRIAHASLFMLRMAQRTSLEMLLKTIEHHSYAKTFCVNQLNKNDGSKKEVASYKIYMNNDIELLKQMAIKDINKTLPSYFEHSVAFDDWDSAMEFLQNNTKFDKATGANSND